MIITTYENQKGHRADIVESYDYSPHFLVTLVCLVFAEYANVFLEK